MPKYGQCLECNQFDQIDDDEICLYCWESNRYRVIRTKNLFFNRWTVVCGTGTWHLFSGSYWECKNVASIALSAYRDGQFSLEDNK